MNETSIDPQSTEADKEKGTDTPDSVTYLVLHRSEDGIGIWRERPWITSKYVPTAAEIGEAYGAGEFLLIERDTQYSFKYAYPMVVVAETVYKKREDA